MFFRRVRARMIIRFFGYGLALLSLCSVISAFAASNTVGVSGAGEDIFEITANDLKPAECSALNLRRIVTGSGLIFGSNQAELIIGSTGIDLIFAGNGNDCVIGSGGNDYLWGNNGGDVLLGGSGDDSLSGGNGQDVCYGGDGTDSADGTCETVYEVP
jgi:Ca2+-binding RTX toxin-like protein